MDATTAITRIFQAFAGVAPDALGSGWQSGISEEIACLLASEGQALPEAARRLALCAAGRGRQASGIDNWKNGAIVLLRIFALSGSPTARAFLRDTAAAGGNTADWAYVRAEAQRLTARMEPPAFRPNAPAIPAGQSMRPLVRPLEAPPARLPVKSLILPVLILFAAWLLALADGARSGVYPNAILCLSAAAYALLLGCALTLLLRRRYAFGVIILVCGALLSALTLGWAKLIHIDSPMGFFSMFGITQFWLDFLVALVPALLTALSALLLPRIIPAATDTAAALCAGLLLFACSTVVMWLTLPHVSLLSLLFSVFSGLMLGAFATATSLFLSRAAPDPRRTIALGGGASAWFALCLGISCCVGYIFITAEESYLPLFALALTLVQIVMLILLLCGRRKGFLWYCAASAAVLLAGLLYFMLAFVLSESWLPLVLLGALLCAVGPAVGCWLIRKRWNASALILLLGACLALSGCGMRSDHVGAVEKAVTGYSDYYLEMYDPGGQVRSQARGMTGYEKAASYDLDIRIPDYSQIDLGELSYSPPAVDYADADYDRYLRALCDTIRQSVDARALGGEIGSYIDARMRVELRLEDGEWSAEIAGASRREIETLVGDMLDRLCADTDALPRECSYVRVAEQKDALLGSLIRRGYTDVVTVTGVDDLGGGQYRLHVRYPDPDEAFTILGSEFVSSFREYFFGSAVCAFEPDDYAEAAAQVAEKSGSITVAMDADGKCAVVDGRAFSEEFTRALQRAQTAAQDEVNARYAIPEVPAPTENTRFFGGGSGTHDFNFTIGEAGVPTYVRMYAIKDSIEEAGTLTASFFLLPNGKTLRISIPAGTYKIVIAWGNTWYGPEYMFGPRAKYMTFYEPVRLKPYYYSHWKPTLPWSRYSSEFVDCEYDIDITV